MDKLSMLKLLDEAEDRMFGALSRDRTRYSVVRDVAKERLQHITPGRNHGLAAGKKNAVIM